MVRSQPTSIPTKHKGINTSASFTKAWNLEKYLSHKIHQDFTAINKFLQRNSLGEQEYLHLKKMKQKSFKIEYVPDFQRVCEHQSTKDSLC